MGFGPADWASGRDGEFRAESGLRLLPRDLLKIGQLVLAGGVWNGHQVVPGDWLKRALTPRSRSKMGAATADSTAVAGEFFMLLLLDDGLG